MDSSHLNRRQFRLASMSAVLLFCAGLVPVDASACTTFLMDGNAGPLVGKSYDWRTTEGLVLINKAGIKKSALVFDTGRPAVWTSRHASVSFNQYGAEMPNGGMNTAGLVVEIMWLRGTKVPASDDRPAINELQWIQYQLDNHTSVSEVVDSAKNLRVSKVYGDVHYLVCDRNATCAALEYVDGRLVVSQGSDLPVPTLTNHTYGKSREFLKRHAGFGGNLAIPRSRGSLERFVRASALSRARKKQGVGEAFEVLDSVSQGDYSVWNIVYDPRTLEVHFRTLKSPAIKTVSLSGFDASCHAPRKMLNIDANGKGLVNSRFESYTDVGNQALIRKTLAPLGGALPPGVPMLLGLYPRSLTCARPGGGSIR